MTAIATGPAGATVAYSVTATDDLDPDPVVPLRAVRDQAHDSRPAVRWSSDIRIQYRGSTRTTPPAARLCLFSTARAHLERVVRPGAPRVLERMGHWPLLQSRGYMLLARLVMRPRARRSGLSRLGARGRSLGVGTSTHLARAALDELREEAQ
jgi:hypothetical protein